MFCVRSCYSRSSRDRTYKRGIDSSANGVDNTRADAATAALLLLLLRPRPVLPSSMSVEDPPVQSRARCGLGRWLRYEQFVCSSCAATIKAAPDSAQEAVSAKSPPPGRMGHINYDRHCAAVSAAPGRRAETRRPPPRATP